MALYQPLFNALNDARVQYVVVGGLATVLHGYARMTADVDLVVNLEQVEAQKAVQAITACGMKPKLPVDPALFADAAIRESWINDKNMLVFSFYDPKNPLLSVDLFVHEPMPYRQLAQRAVHMNIGGVSIPVCSIDDLIQLKRDAGRAKDLEDIAHLEEIRRALQIDRDPS